MAHSPKQNFKHEQNLTVYSKRHKDAAGNRWSLRLYGAPRPVNALLTNGQINYQAVPLSQEEAQAEYDRNYAEYQKFIDARQKQVAKVLNPDLPARKLKASLTKLKETGPYRIEFHIDPELSDPDTYSLGTDQNCAGKIEYTANLGTVKITIEGPGPTIESSGVGETLWVQSKFPAVWRVTVSRASGQPTYTLTGSIVVLQ
ncbi:MAG: hypothetical protein HY870_00325 [Chloroflexi bacterium]|nr:hypothetical protein [Chloroflexota bacterium]